MCGDIVCNDCSQFRAVVDGLGPVPQRICIECHEIQIQKAVRGEINVGNSEASFSKQKFPNSRNIDDDDDEFSAPPPMPPSKKLDREISQTNPQLSLPPIITEEENENETEDEEHEEQKQQSKKITQTQENSLNKSDSNPIKKELEKSSTPQTQAKNVKFLDTKPQKNVDQTQTPIISENSSQIKLKKTLSFPLVESDEDFDQNESVDDVDYPRDSNEETYQEAPTFEYSEAITEEITTSFKTIAEAAESDNIDDIVENVMETVLEVISDITAVELIAMAEIELEEEAEKKKRPQNRAHITPISEHDETWNAISTKMGQKMKEYVINEANQIRRDTSLLSNTSQLQSSTVDAMVNALLKATTSQQRRLTV